MTSVAEYSAEVRNDDPRTLQIYEDSVTPRTSEGRLNSWTVGVVRGAEGGHWDMN